MENDSLGWSRFVNETESLKRDIIKQGSLWVDVFENCSIFSGKRVRQELFIILAQELGLSPTSSLVYVDVAIELLHEASLVHDDIIDQSSYRRGKPSVWKKMGMPHGLLFGDYLFACQEMMVSKSQLVDLSYFFGRCKQKMCDGELLSMSHYTTHWWDWEIYQKIAKLKTSSLFILIAESLLSYKNEKDSSVWHYWQNILSELGVIYQIVNDLEDCFEKNFEDFLGRSFNYVTLLLPSFLHGDVLKKFQNMVLNPSIDHVLELQYWMKETPILPHISNLILNNFLEIENEYFLNKKEINFKLFLNKIKDQFIQKIKKFQDLL